MIAKNILRPCVLILLSVSVFGLQNLPAQYAPQDVTQPNEFYFKNDVYYVDEDATNAVIEVGFVPGNRSYSGAVNFNTSAGTATSGSDYADVSGTLYFSGPAPRFITIPIQQDWLIEGNETVQLSLSNPSALLTRSNATLVIINKAPSVKLDIEQLDGITTISWPTNYPQCTIQKTTNLFAPSWIDVAETPTVQNGKFYISQSVAPNQFFRLHPATN